MPDVESANVPQSSGARSAVAATEEGDATELASSSLEAQPLSATARPCKPIVSRRIGDCMGQWKHAPTGTLKGSYDTDERASPIRYSAFSTSTGCVDDACLAGTYAARPAAISSTAATIA